MKQRRNFNRKVVKYGEKWDSQYELKFFEQFILPNVRPYNSSSKLVCHVRRRGFCPLVFLVSITCFPPSSKTNALDASVRLWSGWTSIGIGGGP